MAGGLGSFMFGRECELRIEKQGPEKVSGRRRRACLRALGRSWLSSWRKEVSSRSASQSSFERRRRKGRNSVDEELAALVAEWVREGGVECEWCDELDEGE